jgi:hypothetical protein
MSGFEVPKRAIAELKRYLAALDPEVITARQAATLFGLFAEIKRLGATGEVLVAPRAAEAGTWKEACHRTPAQWMAASTGTGTGEALSILETAGRLEGLPATTDALQRGKLSFPQASEGQCHYLLGSSCPRAGEFGRSCDSQRSRGLRADVTARVLPAKSDSVRSSWPQRGPLGASGLPNRLSPKHLTIS